MHAIKKYCRTNKVLIKDLAFNVKVRPVYLSQIIMGRRRPSPDLALRIEETTGGAVTRMELLYPKSQNGAADGVIPNHIFQVPTLLFFCCISIAFVPEEERCQKR
jgi:DNA-binding transcriptional regulator YdaS (Cro superfamily)